MTKQQLIEALYSNNSSNLTKKELAEALATLATVATAAIAGGGTVEIPGLVRLSPAERAARPGRNPRTGQPMELPAKTVVKAVICKPLADAVRGE